MKNRRHRAYPRRIRRGSYEVYDQYFYEAKKSGYRARSVFKLEEIQNTFKLIRRGDRVLDLGAAPGSFLQYLIQVVGPETQIVGPETQVVGIDLKPISYIQGAKTHVCDIFDIESLQKILGEQRFDVITSDLAPSTSGIKDIDQARSVELNMQVLEIARRYLERDGNIVMKIFVGSDFQEFIAQCKLKFRQISIFKPQSTRKSSREVYVIGKGFRFKT